MAKMSLGQYMAFAANERKARRREQHAPIIMGCGIASIMMTLAVIFISTESDKVAPTAPQKWSFVQKKTQTDEAQPDRLVIESN